MLFVVGWRRAGSTCGESSYSSVLAVTGSGMPIYTANYSHTTSHVCGCTCAAARARLASHSCVCSTWYPTWHAQQWRSVRALLVPCEAARGREAHAAALVVAGERLVARVRTLVRCDAARLREALAAALVAAGVRPLARVRARVDLECGVGGEGHCAPVDLAVLWEVAADWARNEFSISDMYTCLPYANTSTTPAATHWNKTGQLNTATGHALSHAAHKQASQHGTRDEDLTDAMPTFPQIPHSLHLTHSIPGEAIPTIPREPPSAITMQGSTSHA